MAVDAYDVIDLESDPLMCSESTKTIEKNTSLNSQYVETDHIIHDADTTQLIPNDVGPSNTQQLPTIGMKFETEEKLDDYFKTYAYKVGFGVRRHNVRNEGDRIYYALGCDKRGVHRIEAKGYENLPFGERECRNYIAKVRQLRLGIGDAEALRNYFVRRQRRNKNFFYAMDINDDGP
nr:protein FAR1-related sequence 6-like [Tanacetum cinerariifolium]